MLKCEIQFIFFHSILQGSNITYLMKEVVDNFALYYFESDMILCRNYLVLVFRKFFKK